MLLKTFSKSVAFPGLAFAAVALGSLYFALMSGHLHSIDGLLMYRQGEAFAYEHSLDLNAIDIMWFRLVGQTGGLSLVPMVLLLVLAVVMTTKAIRHSSNSVEQEAESTRTRLALITARAEEG